MTINVLNHSLLLLGLVLVQQTSQAQPSPVLETCARSIAPLAEQLPILEKQSPSAAAILKLLVSDSICACTERRLKAEGIVTLDNTEESATNFMRANIDCQISNFRTEFPPRCQGIYEQLLPTIGYDNPSAEFVQQACACVEGAMDEHASADQVYDSRVKSMRHSIALGNDRRTGGRTARDIEVPPDPLGTAMSSAKACIASHAQRR